jgi:hypothetical protein
MLHPADVIITSIALRVHSNDPLALNWGALLVINHQWLVVSSSTFGFVRFDIFFGVSVDIYLIFPA